MDENSISGTNTNESKALPGAYLRERNWKEDATHENGDYECLCLKCRNTFIGHKRRTMCRVCATGVLR